MIGALILAQATVASTAPAPLPDIEIHAQVQAREVRVEQEGRAAASVFVEPEGAKRIEVELNQPRGQSSYRNLELTLDIEATLTDPAAGEPIDAATAITTEPETGEN